MEKQLTYKQLLNLLQNGEKVESSSEYDGAIVMSKEQAMKFVEDFEAFEEFLETEEKEDENAI